MKTLQFQCKLLSDVILNQKAATEGPNSTLDFIPGSCFLGIVASKYSEFSVSEQVEVFHSGKVRFGDAHPSVSGFRSLKMPVAMYYPKLSSPKEKCYISYRIPNPDSEEIRLEQLKQCRAGFVDFSSNESVFIKTQTNFAIKSAYDREQRRSKDKAMYGYESLQKGLLMYFSVEVDNDALSGKITSYLEGKKRIGRSRTAQYGLVEITQVKFSEVESSACQGDVAVYADSRLIFLDVNGLPSFQPTAQQLGFLKGDINWEKSQIRTFQYAPWNYTRQCFDADRCGIEKGSVIVVENAGDCNLKSQYVGIYNNEGFGKVIYSPAFLSADSNGLAKCTFVDETPKDNNSMECPLCGTQLLDYLQASKTKSESLNTLYSNVNAWTDTNKRRFKESFASQWGGIRSIALRCHSKKELLDELFDKTVKRNDREVKNGYLTHGVASVKWKENGGDVLLRKFIENCADDYVVQAVVNLASEMGKEKRKENKK